MTAEADKPAAEFAVGDVVRVILNERNKTQRTGTIQNIIWHFKDQRYNYYIEENGRSVSKRYFAADLELVMPTQNTA